MSETLFKTYLNQICETGEILSQRGWAERNAGNISICIPAAKLPECADCSAGEKRVFVLPVSCPLLSNRILIVTASGSYMKNLAKAPEQYLGVLRIASDGASAEILFGFEGKAKPTSELASHLLIHEQKAGRADECGVVLHTHPVWLTAMSYVHELKDSSFTVDLWRSALEGILTFPDGIAVMPWQLCGTTDIGIKTAEKMADHRLVLWAMHGVYAYGSSVDDAMGLVEAAEKAAQIYMITLPHPILNTITDDQLKQTAEAMQLNYRKEYLNPNESGVVS